jgi:hypothetical protein
MPLLIFFLCLNPQTLNLIPQACISMVAGQPAIQLSLFLNVAILAKFHLKDGGLQPIHMIYPAMAVAAVQLPETQMGFMPEFDEIGDIKNPHPGYRSAALEMVLFFKDHRVGGYDVFMAEKAFFHFRETGMFGPFHIGMAEPTVDGLHPGMNPVAEGYGLPGPDPLSRIGIKEIDHQAQQEGTYKKPSAP